MPGPIVPPSPATEAQIIINPRTPPPPTSPSTPEVLVPIPAPETLRPVKMFRFQPSLTLSEEYSDNFNLTPTNRQSNYRSSVSPGVLVLLQDPSFNGQLSYRPQAFYDTSAKDAGLNHLLAAQLAWQATPRFTLTGADNFTKSDQPGLADRLGLRRGRQAFTTNGASLTADYSLQPYAFQAYGRESDFSSGSSSTHSRTPGGSASVTLLQINTLTLGYEYLDTKTTTDQAAGSAVFGPTGDSHTTGHQVTATFSRDVRKDLTAGLTAVYATREQEMSGDTTNFTRKSISLFSNYVAPERLVMRSSLGVAQLEGAGAKGTPLITSTSDLRYYLGPAIIGLNVERGFSETFGQGQNFGVVETSGYSGSFTYRFTPLLSTLVSGTYRENKFTGAGGGGQAGRSDKITSATANVTYQVLRWLNATLDYTYTHTTSSDQQAGYTENRIRAALNATFY